MIMFLSSWSWSWSWDSDLHWLLCAAVYFWYRRLYWSGRRTWPRRYTACRAMPTSWLAPWPRGLHLRCRRHQQAHHPASRPTPASWPRRTLSLVLASGTRLGHIATRPLRSDTCRLPSSVRQISAGSFFPFPSHFPFPLPLYSLSSSPSPPTICTSP